LGWYRKRPLFWWGLLFSTGIIFARETPASTILVGSGLVVIFFLIAKFTSHQLHTFYAIIVLSVLFAGGLRYLNCEHRPNSILAHLANAENSVVLEGAILHSDSTRTGKNFYEVDPISVYNRSIQVKPIQVWLPENHPLITPGDTLRCVGVVNLFPRARNPGEFDYRKYQKIKQRYFQFSVRYPWEIQVRSGEPARFHRFVSSIQNKITTIIHQAFDPEPAAFASALILGKRDEINSEVINTYASLGIIHVLAVSGLHVGYVTLILLALLSLFPINFRTTVFLTIAGLVLYAAIVNFRPSVVRASAMASILLLAQASEQRYDILNLLGAAALVILVVNPLELFQIGFQLSFLAVLGIVVFYNRFETALETIGLSIGKLSKPLRYMLGLFLVSVAAFVATAPVTAYYFRMVPVWGLFLNLMVIPLIGVIVIATFVVLITGMFWPALSGIYAEVPNALIHLMNNILQFLYHSGFHAIHLPGFSAIFILIVYAILTTFLFIRMKNLVRYSFFGVLILVNVFIWKPNPVHPLRITFLDVGQGDAALIESPHGKTMLIDAGIRTLESDRGADVIIPYLQYRGIDHIDIAVLSHPHNDHIGGFPSILRKYRVSEIWDSKHSYHTNVMHEVRTLSDSQGTRYHLIQAGFDTTIDQIHFRTFFPVSQEIDNNINNHSIVQRLTYEQTSVLFPGDIEAKVEPYVDRFGQQIHAQLLKVPHHGSITSSTTEFINTVDPKFAIVSVGADNKFDHPSDVVLKRYRRQESQLLLTRDEGAVIFQSDGFHWKQIHWR